QKLTARQQDPDYAWLSADTTQNHPYVRFRTGEGRFLIRVTYEPRFRQERSNPTYNFDHDFDPNSMLVHVESIGRPGVVDPDHTNHRPEQPGGAAESELAARANPGRVPQDRGVGAGRADGPAALDHQPLRRPRPGDDRRAAVPGRQRDAGRLRRRPGRPARR